MKTISQQLEDARNEAESYKATWMANKDKSDRKSRQIARNAAERLEWATNQVAMLNAMVQSGKF